MRNPRRPDEEGSFEVAWRRWLERPVRIPASEAAARIAARLAPRPRASVFRWVPLAAAAALALAIGIALLRGPAPPPVPPVVEGPGDLPLGEGEVLLWLDEGTPLYMTFQPPAAPASPEEKS